MEGKQAVRSQAYEEEERRWFTWLRIEAGGKRGKALPRESGTGNDLQNQEYDGWSYK